MSSRNRSIKQGSFPPVGGNTRQKIHFWFSVAVMLMIFLHSAMPSDLSAQESGVIVAFLMERMNSLFGSDQKMTTFIVRKGAHFLEYAVLGFSLCLTADDYQTIYEENRSVDAAIPEEGNRAADAAIPRRPAFRKNIIPWLIGTAYAVTDEVHQLFVPGRSCELRDIMIDSCGVAAGILICRIIKKWKKRLLH